ncbi:MAG TPA: hypothetical protein VKS79_21115 [Gemmataceae bacterium]|nr:hypothetical protein [Gemmataceae bacterium]
MADPVPSPAPIKPGWQSTEFYALIGKILTSVVLLFVVLGKIKPDAASGINEQVTAIIAAVGSLIAVVGVNGFVVHKYIASRTELKS